MTRILSYLWRILPIAAIIFQAGISGAWWAGQFRLPLPAAWGWFGAALIGVAMWSGVELVVRGQRSGWALVTITATADSVMAWAYFADGHPAGVAIALAIAPAAITILTGWQASQQMEISESQVRQVEEARMAFELEQRALDREVQRKAMLIAARAEAKARTAPDRHVRPADSVRTVSEPVSEPRTDGRTAALEWLTEDERHVVPADIVRQFNAGTDRTARRWLNAAGYGPNGDGRWAPLQGS